MNAKSIIPEKLNTLIIMDFRYIYFFGDVICLGHLYYTALQGPIYGPCYDAIHCSFIVLLVTLLRANSVKNKIKILVIEINKF